MIKVTFRGWPGHYICADRCQFRLNTLLKLGKFKVVVSTVGRMVPLHSKDQKFETIACGRYLETMAFESDYTEWDDVDVAKRIDFDSPWLYSKPDMEKEANAGHYKVIEEIKAKMLSGELKPQPDTEEGE